MMEMLFCRIVECWASRVMSSSKKDVEMLDSEKHDYCVAYPEAGLFFADMKESGSIEGAIKAALNCDPKKIDRRRIRERFSEERIAAEFIEQLECEDLGLLKGKWMARV